MFSVRIKPMNDESFISFMTRFASENGTKMLSIWHDNSRTKGINPQKADAHLLDLTPETFIFLEDLAQATEVSKDRLIAMTCYNVLRKFCYPDEISRSRILRGMIRDELHFCPLCIKEKGYFKLSWKMDGVNYCLKHQVPLSHSCSHCGNLIKLMDIQHTEVCPYCNTELKHTHVIIRRPSMEELKEQNLLQIIWGQLLYYSGEYMSTTEVATRIIYLLNGENYYFDRSIVKRNADLIKIYLPYLLQLARDSLHKKRTVHIRTLLDVLKFYNIDYEYFERLTIPNEFRESICTTKRDTFMDSGCMAPWCTFFQKSGSFLRIRSSSKRYSDGSPLRNNVACTACGSRFAFNTDGIMVEQDGFLKEYHVLSNLFKKNGKLLLQECRRPVDCNRDRWWSVLAYFSTRPIFNRAEQLDEELLLTFVQTVEKNGNMKNINKWKCWNSYRHFLLYRYHPQVMNALVFSKRKVPVRHNIKAYEEKIVSLCRAMLENDQDISVERVCSLIKITSNTLRAWGLHQYIKDMKNEQSKKRLAARKEHIIEKVNQFFLHNENCRVLSKDIYKFIGVSQAYLISIAPDLNQYINEQKMKYSSIL